MNYAMRLITHEILLASINATGMCLKAVTANNVLGINFSNLYIYILEKNRRKIFQLKIFIWGLQLLKIEVSVLQQLLRSERKIRYAMLMKYARRLLDAARPLRFMRLLKSLTGGTLVPELARTIIDSPLYRLRWTLNLPGGNSSLTCTPPRGCRRSRKKVALRRVSEGPWVVQPRSCLPLCSPFRNSALRTTPRNRRIPPDLSHLQYNRKEGSNCDDNRKTIFTLYI